MRLYNPIEPTEAEAEIDRFYFEHITDAYTQYFALQTRKDMEFPDFPQI